MNEKQKQKESNNNGLYTLLPTVLDEMIEYIEELKNKHEAIRTVLMDKGCKEYGDCIIDEICEAVGILPTTVYYIEGE
jgi:Mg2+ and Co2+ transporter CorA